MIFYPDLREYLPMKVNAFFSRHMSIDVLLEVLIRYLVAIFELAIIITLFLHSVIGKMNKPVP